MATIRSVLLSLGLILHMAHANSSAEASISCLPGFDGSSDQLFEPIYQDIDEARLHAVNTSDSQIVLRDLKMRHGYSLLIIANNARGDVSDLTEPLLFRRLDENQQANGINSMSKKDGPISQSTIVANVIGLISLLVLNCALICHLNCQNRQRRMHVPLWLLLFFLFIYPARVMPWRVSNQKARGVELLLGGIVLDHSRLQTRIATALAEAAALPPHQGAWLVRRLQGIFNNSSPSTAAPNAGRSTFGSITPLTQATSGSPSLFGGGSVSGPSTFGADPIKHPSEGCTRWTSLQMVGTICLVLLLLYFLLTVPFWFKMLWTSCKVKKEKQRKTLPPPEPKVRVNFGIDLGKSPLLLEEGEDEIPTIKMSSLQSP